MASKVCIVTVVAAFLLLTVLMPCASAYEGKVHLPAMEDGVPGEYILRVEARWGDTIKWSFAVDRGAVEFLVVRPNLNVHFSSRGFAPEKFQATAPETGTYMLVWRNKEAVGEKVLEFDVDVEPNHLAVILGAAVCIVALFASVIYMKWKWVRQQRVGPPQDAREPRGAQAAAPPGPRI